MNAFDLERKGYIRINNNGGDPLTDFYKYTFYTSFVITGDIVFNLPNVNNSTLVESSNGSLNKNAQAYSYEFYPDGSKYACYICVDKAMKSGVNTNIPYAKVNVYIGYENESIVPVSPFMLTQNGDFLVTEDDINILIQ